MGKRGMNLEEYNKSLFSMDLVDEEFVGLDTREKNPRKEDINDGIYVTISRPLSEQEQREPGRNKKNPEPIQKEPEPAQREPEPDEKRNVQESVQNKPEPIQKKPKEKREYPILINDQNGKEFGIVKTPFVIGKGEGCNLRVNNKAISRKHLQITRYGENFFLEDMGSTNGTFVNGQRIEAGERIKIKDGQEIILANKKYLIRF